MCSLRLKIVVVVISFFVSFADAISQEQVLAQLESCEGVVMRQISGRGAFQAISTGTLLRSSDIIQTGRNSRAAISFRDGGFLRIAENSSLQLEAKSGGSSNSKVIMPFGRAYYFSREPKAAPDFETPSVTTAIHGTEFALESNQNTTSVSVLDGSVRLTNPMGQLSLSSGEQGRASKDSAPLKTILIKPLDAVQWALYYPTLLSVSDLTKLKEAASKEEAFAISALEQRQKTAAISMLENAPDTGNPEIDLLKASLYVEQGDVTKAQALISSLNSKDDSAYSNTFKARLSALNAIILVAQNNKEEAQQLAATAYALDPKTPEALLARSYTSQASFQIEEAYEWAKKLVELLPNNSFAHARLAELEMGFGRNEEALKQAKQAMELDSNNSYALTVYGFSNLFRRMPDKAIESFERAALNDGVSSLPLLGLGLAKINKGLLEDGRRDIEKAAFLAPQVAIYRSYLGKAFFEEEREGLAGHEYDRAISLDPLDPTSYLYRAYNQLSANDPVQALKDVEKSIELNDNRAVYRSSLLLDQDLAVRSAGLSETFTSLGFSQAARVEAIKSINKDYSNYSAHLLLADSYEMILTSDASTSEKALVDLLAPLSFNLFQRQAGDASLNEYNALFDRPDQRTGVLTSASTYNDRIAPQIQHAAKGEDSAYALSLGSELTKGSKHNNFSRLNRAMLLGSYQFDADSRALLEGTTTYYDVKELNMSPDQKEDEDFTIRSGYQHHLDSNSQLIADFSYSQIRSNSLAHSTFRQAIWNEIIDGESFQRDYDILTDELSREALRLFRGNIQHIYDSEIVSLISGFHGQATHTLRKENSPVLEDSDSILSSMDYYINTRGENELSSNDSYIYGIFHLGKVADLTLGGSFSHVEGEHRELAPFLDNTFKKDRLNPKIGFISNPIEDLTLRAAYFETLAKSTFEDNILIEPSMVAGINQRFTDDSATQARNLGAGVDYKIGALSYFGVEAIRRHTVHPYYEAKSFFIVNYDDMTLAPRLGEADPWDYHRNENFLKAYYSQVWTAKLVSNIDYSFSRFDATDPEINDDVKLHKTSAELRYFSVTGLFPFINATWREQTHKGNFLAQDGTSAFWTFDVGLGYRIPERHGAVLLKIENILDEDFVYYQGFGLEPLVHSGIGFSLNASFNF